MKKKDHDQEVIGKDQIAKERNKKLRNLMLIKN